jgi:hypothetical protein
MGRQWRLLEASAVEAQSSGQVVHRALPQQQQQQQPRVYPQQREPQQVVVAAAVAGAAAASSRTLHWLARPVQQRQEQTLRRLGAPLERCSQPAA